jgi:cbb3-type cytochrome c oxidase subunit III
VGRPVRADRAVLVRLRLRFPGLGASPGTLGWTSRGELEADQAKVAASMAKVYAEYAQQPAEALSRDVRAMAIGQRLFINNCATCHGSDARGSKGFPNLTDGDWLHGGTPEKIEETITLGRTGVMPPMAAAVGSTSDVRDVANYVMSLSATRTTRSPPRRAGRSSPPAPPATAPTARATRRSARPTSPTRSGCTAGASRRSST